MVYYNDNDPYCAGWLRNLIAAGLIPWGIVDDRPIQEVTVEDVAPYTQCHFFAGIGGWPYALRLAGWPDDRPVWTGSCPCQPFSVAGARKGFDDERDLWPEWLRLVAVGHPSVVFGEQVASSAPWLARVRGDLEVLGYAVGAAPIQAACAGAAQYRDRYWFVADSAQHGIRPFERKPGAGVGSEEPFGGFDLYAGDGSLAGRDLEREGDGGLPRGGELGRASGAEEDPRGIVAGSHECREGQRHNDTRQPHPEGCREDGVVASVGGAGLEEQQGIPGDDGSERPPGERDGVIGLVRPPLLGWGEGWTESEFRGRGFTAAVASSPDGSVQFIECPDGKWRRLPPPRVRWLGNGIPARVAKLRALGNAIYPPVAAEFVRAYMDEWGLPPLRDD